MTTEGLPRLDVRVLARESFLLGGTSAAIAWHSGESVWKTITIHVHASEPDAVILEYSVLTSNESRLLIRERIRLETAPCTYGEERS